MQHLHDDRPPLSCETVSTVMVLRYVVPMVVAFLPTLLFIATALEAIALEQLDTSQLSYQKRSYS